MAVDNESDFKVTDRRIFNPDGTLRDGIDIDQPAAQPEPVLDTLSAQQSSFAPAPAVEHHNHQQAHQHESDEYSDMPEQTPFTGFLMEVASTAFIYLGMVEHPATGRKQIDLHSASEYINILMMLKDKTKGNLTKGEEKFFDDLIADMQMQFTAISRRQH